ncbi:unnamed protein product [Rhizophagus irregularis]|nr:unnamed protein product [Rhizophagus irregularis]
MVSASTLNFGSESTLTPSHWISIGSFTLDRYRLRPSFWIDIFILDRYLHSGSVSASTLNFGIWICIGFDLHSGSISFVLDRYRLRPLILESGSVSASTLHSGSVSASTLHSGSISASTLHSGSVSASTFRFGSPTRAFGYAAARW